MSSRIEICTRGHLDDNLQAAGIWADCNNMTNHGIRLTEVLQTRDQNIPMVAGVFTVKPLGTDSEKLPDSVYIFKAHELSIVLEGELIVNDESPGAHPIVVNERDIMRYDKDAKISQYSKKPTRVFYVDQRARSTVHQSQTPCKQEGLVPAAVFILPENPPASGWSGRVFPPAVADLLPSTDVKNPMVCGMFEIGPEGSDYTFEAHELSIVLEGQLIVRDITDGTTDSDIVANKWDLMRYDKGTKISRRSGPEGMARVFYVSQRKAS